MSHVGIQNWTPLQQQYTILRDPIDRIISYFYATQDATQVSLDDWIDIPNYSIRNAMTWMLAGSSQFKPEQAVTTQSTFEKAMSNLRHMDIVGTTENLNLFMFMLSNRLNIRFDEVPHTNQSERPLLDRVPQRIRNKIADLNKFDLKLWKEAKEWL